MSIKYDLALQRSLIHGDKKVIGWGVPSDLLLKLKQSPYKFEFLIDGTKEGNTIIGHSNGLDVYAPTKIQEVCNSEFVIVILADLNLYGKAISEQIKQYGNYIITTPYYPWLEEAVEKKILHFVNKYKSKSINKIKPPERTPAHNIALVIYGFTRGGAEWQFYLLAKALVAQGHSVSVFYFTPSVDSTKCWLDDLESLGVTLFCVRDYIHDLDVLKYASLTEELLSFLSIYESRLVLGLQLLMRDMQFDYCISYLLSANVLASLSALLLGIPNTLISTRCSAPGTVSNDFVDTKIDHVDLNTSAKLLEVIITQAGVNIAANSNVGAHSYAKWLNISKQSIAVVPNGMLQPELVSKQSIRDAYGISNHAFLVLGVMRLTEQKRPFLFLDCIEELRMYQHNLKVLLIGDGKLFSEVKKIVNEKGLQNIITLLGECPKATDFMQAADVLLHTSKFEGLPNVILEAQQVGCPVVCSNAGGSSEALAPELLTVSLVSTDKPADYVSKILDFCDEGNIEYFKSYADKHIKHMSLEALATNTLQAASRS